MAINLIPIFVIGGAIALMGRKRRPKKYVKNPPSLPASGRGVIFEGDTDRRPSGIRAKVGERFSITFTTNSALPGSWKLTASPADGSIQYVGVEHDDIADSVTGPDTADPSGKDIFIFDAVKSGSGSLVFHWQIPWLEGEEPPQEVVEILTEIS